MRTWGWLRPGGFVFLACVGMGALSIPTPAPAAERAGSDLDAVSVDISGDGVVDGIQVVLKGENHLECVDGATGQVLWESPCYLKDWGAQNSVGHVVGPKTRDINEDGLPDLIFQAQGCDAIVALDRRTGRPLWSLPARETVGTSAVAPDLYRGRDLVDIGDLLAIGITDPGKLRPEEATVGGAIMALDPRDGSVRWRAPVPIDRRVRIGRKSGLALDHPGVERSHRYRTARACGDTAVVRLGEPACPLLPGRGAPCRV